jgi:hypothetical protein
MRRILHLLSLSLVAFAMQAQTAGTLTVSATTSATSMPDYGPKNVVAIWVEDSNGKFIKSLLVMAAARKTDLIDWYIASGYGKNVVDAVTGATVANYGVQSCTWNGTDENKNLVADGTYNLRIESTDNSADANNLASFSFTKGSSKQTYTPANQSGFSAVSITWTPAGTAVNNPSFSSLYSVYPARTSSTVFVDGADIESIDVLSYNGGFLFKSTVQELNLSSLPNGVYLLSINTLRGTLVKKVIKR